MKINSLKSVTMILALAFGGVAQAAAPVHQVINQKSGTLEANVASFSTDACPIMTSLFVNANQESTNADGPNVPPQIFVVALIQKLDCNFHVLSYVYAADYIGSGLTVNGTTSGTLNATMSGYDYITDTASPIAINLTWTATGSTGHENQIFRNRFLGTTIMQKTDRSFRFAGLTGSVVYQGTDIMALPLAYSNDSISNVHSGSLTITRY